MNIRIGRPDSGSGCGPKQTFDPHVELWTNRYGDHHGWELLTSSLDALGIGIEIWDADDRLSFCNDKVNHIHAGFLLPAHIGQTYEALMRANLARHLFEVSGTQEEEWLAHRIQSRNLHSEHLLQELPGDQWINTYKSRSPGGYMVVVRVDVTELVREIRTLEVSNQQLARQSATDGLTGLANRRCFDELLATEWQRAARSGTSLSLLMIDIDYFKRFNDRYGHLAGDDCLRLVASVLGQCARRAGDVAARYGGEEFVLLLPGADAERACDTAQKCLEKMQSAAMPHAASPVSQQVTFSIGVATLLPDFQRDASSLVNAADVAMYRAKTVGRACYLVANPEDWEIEKDTPRSGFAALD
ncbi:MAG: diguanylate cyclase [Rhodoferax sp.]|uniref:GGDEF domain-containing protein n=1 Tax=Rhodoferax sp. TaxID=50421 RepID=UPI003017B7A4